MALFSLHEQMILSLILVQFRSWQRSHSLSGCRAEQNTGKARDLSVMPGTDCWQMLLCMLGVNFVSCPAGNQSICQPRSNRGLFLCICVAGEVGCRRAEKGGLKHRMKVNQSNSKPKGERPWVLVASFILHCRTCHLSSYPHRHITFLLPFSQQPEPSVPPSIKLLSLLSAPNSIRTLERQNLVTSTLWTPKFLLLQCFIIMTDSRSHYSKKGFGIDWLKSEKRMNHPGLFYWHQALSLDRFQKNFSSKI